jgi:hypothetical protein
LWKYSHMMAGEAMATKMAVTASPTKAREMTALMPSRARGVPLWMRALECGQNPASDEFVDHVWCGVGAVV